MTSLRDALRRWLRQPGLAVASVLVLALGIGGTTAMFSVVHDVLLKEEPWQDANRLVRIYAVLPQQRTNPAFASRWNRAPISWQSWRDLQKAASFSDVAAYLPGQHVAGDDRGELVRSFFASSTLPLVLGATPLHGRFFTAAEDDADSGTVIVSYRVWLRLLGGDPAAVGKVLTISRPGEPGTSVADRRRVIGILPAGFSVPGEEVDLLLPLGYHKYNGSFGNQFLLTLARLARGISIGAASASAEALVRRDEPADRRSARIVAVTADRIGLGAAPLWLMLSGAALLMVVASSNVAGLLLGNVRVRRYETAVRLSLGATRAAVIRQHFVEHAVLAATAAGAGLILASWLIPVLTSLAPKGLLAGRVVGLDSTVAVWSVLAAMVVTMAAGLIPSAAVAGASPSDMLKRDARQATREGRWRHRAVVTTQFALTLVLLVGAGLFGETLIRLGRERLGFQPDGVVIGSIERARQRRRPVSTDDIARMSELRRTQPDALISMVEAPALEALHALIRRIQTLPDVAAVAATSAVPFVGEPASSAMVRSEQQTASESQAVLAVAITDSYFSAMRIDIVAGRSFQEIDRLPYPRPAIVSRQLAESLFEGRAVGRKLIRGQVSYDVVGVVEDVKHRAQSEPTVGTVYFPLRTAGTARHLVVRTSGGISPLMSTLRPLVESGESALFMPSGIHLADAVGSAIVNERARARLAAMYGGVALVLASVGLYGLTARLVAERRREIGIRVALGAGRRDVRRLVMADAWTIVGAGLVVGVPTAYAASRLTHGMLYGVEPTSPRVFAMAAIALTLAAIVATLVPSWRANRVDPAVTLREE